MNRKLRRQLTKKLKESTLEQVQAYRKELDTWADTDLEGAGPRQIKRYQVALALTEAELDRRTPKPEVTPEGQPKKTTKKLSTGAECRAEAGPSSYRVLGYRI